MCRTGVLRDLSMIVPDSVPRMNSWAHHQSDDLARITATCG
jgi:hypothetical protein